MIDKAYCIVFLSPLAGRMEIFMINVSGHLRNERRATGFEDLSTALTVNCCGMQIFKTKDYKQNRAAGRVDYQLIYIYKTLLHSWKVEISQCRKCPSVSPKGSTNLFLFF